MHIPQEIILSATVASHDTSDEWDIKQLKKALNRLGYYIPKGETGITGEASAHMFDALKAFQHDQKLNATGRIAPNDDTLRRLNDEAAKTPKGYYIWRTAGDGKVRPAHSQFNGTVRSWDDSPDPGEDYNCRCWAEKTPGILDGVPDEEIMELIESNEKPIDYMYVDSKGVVTVGIGTALPTVEDAKKLSFIIADPKAKSGWRRAAPEEIETAYKKVKARDFARNMRASYYNPEGKPELSNMTLPRNIAIDQTYRHLQSDVKVLERKFPEFKTFPPQAQNALIDMQYNSGLNPKERPKLFSSVKAQDWRTAAQESHREAVGTDRNHKTQDLFREASRAR